MWADIVAILSVRHYPRRIRPMDLVVLVVVVKRMMIVREEVAVKIGNGLSNLGTLDERTFWLDQPFFWIAFSDSSPICVEVLFSTVTYSILRSDHLFGALRVASFSPQHACYVWLPRARLHYRAAL